jgi:hypothetical protein
MASSYSTDLKLELMVTGENSGTWGDKTNTNLNLIQQAIAGYQSIALTSTNTTLSMTNATISDARNAVIEFTGTLSANSTVYVETGIEKTYTIKNSTTGAFTLAINQVGGSSVIWGTTEKNIKQVYLNGTNANVIDLSTLGGSINTSTALANSIVTASALDTAAVTSFKVASFAVTSSGLDTSAVTSVKIASFAVTSGALDTASVTSVKVASGAIGTAQLATTGVTAATYTAATITVAADGRITSASSGSGGAGMGIPVLIAVGPSTGTYTKNTSANRIGVYMIAGGGNAGNPGSCAGGGGGGAGGFGFYNYPTTTPFSQPYSVGSNNAGTNLTNVGTVNRGNNGNNSNTPNGGSPGNPGTAPGASLTIPTNSQSFVVGATQNGLAYGRGGNDGNPGGPGVLVVFENTGT